MISAIATLFLLVPTRSSEPVDLDLVARIRTEAFQNSQVMDTVSTIADRFGARLTGSAALEQAQKWCVQQLIGWGLTSARTEPWGTIPRGWELSGFSAEMIAPSYVRLLAMPKAWTPGTKGVITGTPVRVEIKGPEDFAKYKGHLHGAIILAGKPGTSHSRLEPMAKRLTATELIAMESATEPGEPKSLAEEDKEWKEMIEKQDSVTKFLSDEGVGAMLIPSNSALGTVRVMTQSYTLDSPSANFPAFVVSPEHYGRMWRLSEKGIPVTVRLSTEARFVKGPISVSNVLAELPGSSDEVVMVGGHLDSWHAATGATDNAAGCGVAMEALRILAILGVKPRRTIRIGLWGGEEQDYYGSGGYVNRHLGSTATGVPNDEGRRMSAYCNIDNGGGKIRGIYLQGNERARPIFEALLAPFASLGANTVTVQSTGGTDHLPFDSVGVPAFQFIQDPLDYDSFTHHTSTDVVETLVPEDLRQAAAVLASVLIHVANREAAIPRKGSA